MSESIREQVSAFLDGELPDPETELLMKRLMRDGELRAAFGRYCLIGEALRGASKGDRLTRDFGGRLNRAIDGEPAVAGTPPAMRARRWWRPFAGAAVAAGVAAVAVLAIERRTDVPVLRAANPPAASVPAGVPSQAAPREALSYTVPAVGPESPGALLPQARLINYVFAHSRYSLGLGRRNVLSELISEQLPEEPPPSDPMPQAAPFSPNP